MVRECLHGFIGHNYMTKFQLAAKKAWKTRRANKVVTPVTFTQTDLRSFYKQVNTMTLTRARNLLKLVAKVAYKSQK